MAKRLRVTKQEKLARRLEELFGTEDEVVIKTPEKEKAKNFEEALAHFDFKTQGSVQCVHCRAEFSRTATAAMLEHKRENRCLECNRKFMCKTEVKKHAQEKHPSDEVDGSEASSAEEEPCRRGSGGLLEKLFSCSRPQRKKRVAPAKCPTCHEKFKQPKKRKSNCSCCDQQFNCRSHQSIEENSKAVQTEEEHPVIIVPNAPLPIKDEPVEEHTRELSIVHCPKCEVQFCNVQSAHHLRSNCELCGAELRCSVQSQEHRQGCTLKPSDAPRPNAWTMNFVNRLLSVKRRAVMIFAPEPEVTNVNQRVGLGDLGAVKNEVDLEQFENSMGAASLSHFLDLDEEVSLPALLHCVKKEVLTDDEF